VDPHSSPHPCQGGVCPIAYTREERYALSEWLQVFPWNYFLTVTFRWWARPEQSQTHFEYIRRSVARYHPERLFLGAELHTKGDLHIHGLYAQGEGTAVAPQGYPRATDLWSVFFRRFGRSKVEVVHSKSAVVSYCTKYVTKELTDYNIW